VGLFGFHISIIVKGITTYEYLKEQWKTYGQSPFKR
jgi:hypothetical protein